MKVSKFSIKGAKGTCIKKNTKRLSRHRYFPPLTFVVYCCHLGNIFASYLLCPNMVVSNDWNVLFQVGPQSLLTSLFDPLWLTSDQYSSKLVGTYYWLPGAGLACPLRAIAMRSSKVAYFFSQQYSKQARFVGQKLLLTFIFLLLLVPDTIPHIACLPLHLVTNPDKVAHTSCMWIMI